MGRLIKKFGRIKEVLDTPYLLQLQKESYKDFFAKGLTPRK